MIARIERIVAQIIECASMNVIREGLADDIDDSTRGILMRGAHAIGIDIEFLFGIGIGKEQIGVDIEIVEVDAIQKVGDAIRAEYQS